MIIHSNVLMLKNTLIEIKSFTKFIVMMSQTFRRNFFNPIYTSMYVSFHKNVIHFVWKRKSFVRRVINFIIHLNIAPLILLF